MERRAKGKEDINIKKKFEMEVNTTVAPVGCYLCRNDAPEAVIQQENLSLAEKMSAAVLGLEGGDNRRSYAAPPMMVGLSGGTANPTDAMGEYAYNKRALETQGSFEIACLIPILWVTTTLAEAVRHPLQGLAGDDGNELLTKL